MLLDLPSTLADGIDGLCRTHFLTAEAGYTALACDNGFAIDDIDQVFGAGFGAAATADALIRHDARVRTLTGKEVMEKSIG